MNNLKITLVVIVVMAILAGIFFWIQNIRPPATVKPIENQFIAEIINDIEKLKKKPDNSFCKESYKEIAYKINEFHKGNRFSTDPAVNDQEKKNLESNLYVAYAEKFIFQSKTVFCGSQWKPEDLAFIQKEKNELKRSILLVSGSPVDKEFTTLQTVLDKYNEIDAFIFSCYEFVFLETDLSARFPIAEVQNKIDRINSLLDNGLGNVFVNNCTRLHTELRKVPQALFEKHVYYLDRKIDNWSGMYPNYSSQNDYFNNLYTPIRNEIENLDDVGYNVSNLDNEYNKLLIKWIADNASAYNYPYK